MTASKLISVLKRVLPQEVPAEITVVLEDIQEMELRCNRLVGGTRRKKILTRIRVEERGRVGEQCTNVFNLPSLRRALAQARSQAENGRQGPLLLSSGAAAGPPASGTAKMMSEREQGAALASVAELAGSVNILASGKLTSRQGECAIVNTAGLAAGAGGLQQQATIKASSSNGLGQGYGHASRKNGALKTMDVFLTAAAKCQATEKQLPLALGEYTVIFEPAAAAVLMSAVARIFFGGGNCIQGKANLTGSRIFSEQLNIWDEPAKSLLPFDFERAPNGRLDLIKAGVLQSPCHDPHPATLFGASAVASDNPFYALQRHLTVGAGNAMLDDMIASTDSGILVSHLEEVAIVDPHAALIAGVTSGGTLLVNNGRLVAGLPDLEFVQDLTLALDNLEMVGDKAEFFGELWQGCTTPALKIRRFSFLPATPARLKEG